VGTGGNRENRGEILQDQETEPFFATKERKDRRGLVFSRQLVLIGTELFGSWISDFGFRGTWIEGKLKYDNIKTPFWWAIHPEIPT
jgi:hypothetical protein